MPVKLKNKLLGSIAPILYIQSDCDTPSGRDYLVEELAQYVKIDSYGKCLNNKEFPKMYVIKNISLYLFQNTYYFLYQNLYSSVRLIFSLVCSRVRGIYNVMFEILKRHLGKGTYRDVIYLHNLLEHLHKDSTSDFAINVSVC